MNLPGGFAISNFRAEPTVAGIASGHDEVLDYAIHILTR
jgi:hypothetical protein